MGQIASNSTYASSYSYGSNSYLYDIEIIENSQSIDNNTTNVTVNFYITAKSSKFSGWSDDDATFVISSNNEQSFNNNSSIRSAKPNCTTYGSKVLVSSWTGTFNNKDNGSLVITASVTYGWSSNSSNYYTPKTTTISASGSATTIPRATTPVLSDSSKDMGQIITINTPRVSDSFTHTLTYQFGSATGAIASNVTTSAGWTIPLSLANNVTNATALTGTIICKTYNDSTLIGTKSVAFTATVPDSVVPSISSVSITEAVEGLASKFNGFVQNRTMLNVAITASGIYGSTITRYETTIQSINYLGSSFTSNLITTSGIVSVLITVTDSRGRTKQQTNNITVIEYSTPTITAFSAYRCDSSGNADDDGTRLNVTVNFNIAPVNNLNDKSYEILYRVKGATDWAGTLASGNVYSINDSFVSSSAFNTDNAYDVIIRLKDYFITSDDGVNATIDIPTAFTLFDCRSTGKGIAFGKVSTKDVMEVALDLELTGDFIQESRQTPTLLNSWVNYSSSIVTHYWKDKNGVVHLDGIIKNGDVSAQTAIMTLPTGYRPSNAELFTVSSVNETCMLEIDTSGNLKILSGANPSWIALSNIHFRVA